LFFAGEVWGQCIKKFLEVRSVLGYKGSDHSRLEGFVANQEQIQYAKQMIGAIDDFARRDWVPATSSNFSCFLPESEQILITQSGRDKGHLSVDDFMTVDADGKAIEPATAKPSAETLLHTMMYEPRRAGAVFHTHSVNATYISRELASEGCWVVEGVEIIKAFSGNKTHDTRLTFPIFANTQDMTSLSRDVAKYLEEHSDTPGYLIAGHGLYTWGQTISDAKRHVEAMEFLLNLELIGRRNGRH